jgi:hypothetical protein
VCIELKAFKVNTNKTQDTGKGVRKVIAKPVEEDETQTERKIADKLSVSLPYTMLWTDLHLTGSGCVTYGCE